MSRSRPLPLLPTALVSVGLLFLTACGARVPSTLREQAANAAVNGGGGAGPGGTGIGPSTGPGGTATGPGGPSGTGPGGPGGTGPGGGTGAGTGNKPNPVAGGNGGATDIGVTANSITVGNVADLTGPVPGLFKTAPDGVGAYFRYINSVGGVNGRFLYVSSADSQTSCTGDTTAHQDQLKKVFGWVGSFALYDDCGTDNVIKKNPTIPDLSFPLGPDTKANTTNSVPPEAAPLGYQNGPYCYWAQKYGSAVQHVGSIYPNLPAPATSQAYFKKASETCGWKWAYNNPEPAAQTTFYSDILNMQRKGVKLVYISAENAQNAATLKAEADSQNFHPIWVIPIAYASDFASRLASAGDSGAGALEGIQGSNLYGLFFSPDDAHNIPEVALFQKWISQAYPGDAKELYAMYSWCAAKLFVQTLKAIGPKVTRSSALASLKKVHSYDCGGMLPATDINNHSASNPKLNCYVLWQIHSGGYYRRDTPPSHFRCDGTFVPLH
jgi:ABC-type branched-subunit amino acid transport system substrate-binding protein